MRRQTPKGSSAVRLRAGVMFYKEGGVAMLIFSEEDTRTMLHVAYVMEELADAVAWLPMAPSQEALASMFEDVPPTGPTPPKPDWKSLAFGVEFAAGHSAWVHETYGRDSVLAEREYYELQEREMEQQLDEKERWS